MEAGRHVSDFDEFPEDVKSILRQGQEPQGTDEYGEDLEDKIALRRQEEKRRLQLRNGLADSSKEVSLEDTLLHRSSGHVQKHSQKQVHNDAGETDERLVVDRDGRAGEQVLYTTITSNAESSTFEDDGESSSGTSIAVTLLLVVLVIVGLANHRKIISYMRGGSISSRRFTRRGPSPRKF